MTLWNQIGQDNQSFRTFLTGGGLDGLLLGCHRLLRFEVDDCLFDFLVLFDLSLGTQILQTADNWVINLIDLFSLHLFSLAEKGLEFRSEDKTRNGLPKQFITEELLFRMELVVDLIALGVGVTFNVEVVDLYMSLERWSFWLSLDFDQN